MAFSRFSFGEGRLNSEYMHVIKMKEKASLLRSHSFWVWMRACPFATVVVQGRQKLRDFDESCRISPFHFPCSPLNLQVGKELLGSLYSRKVETFHLLLWEGFCCYKGRRKHLHLVVLSLQWLRCQQDKVVSIMGGHRRIKA